MAIGLGIAWWKRRNIRVWIRANNMLCPDTDVERSLGTDEKLAVGNSNSLARNEDNVESREPLFDSDSPNGRKSCDASFTSNVESLSSLLLKHDVVVLICAPGSEKENIMMKIIETFFKKVKGGNVRYVCSLDQFEKLDKDPYVKIVFVFDSEATNQDFFSEMVMGEWV
ncbi:uncharacterized protein LOC144626156 [Crassostrea virginica]